MKIFSDVHSSCDEKECQTFCPEASNIAASPKALPTQSVEMGGFTNLMRS